MAAFVKCIVYLVCFQLCYTEGQPTSTTTQVAIQCDNPMMRPRVQESVEDVPVCVTVTTGDMDPPGFDLFVTVTEGSATSGDFVLLNSEPPLSPMSVNGRQTVCTNIEIINDDEVETTESFTVGFTLRRSVDNETLATCEVLILDDDTVECSDHLFLFPESEGQPEICVAVNGVPQNDTIISQIGVNVTATEGSATSDDFQLSESATLRSTGGGVQACTTVEIIDDEEVEGEERFTIELTLSRPAIGSLSAATASCSIEVRILDDDIECVSDTVTYSENAGERMVCVVARGVRQSNSEIAIEVTANGNATRGEDFQIFNQPFFVEPRTAMEEVQACTSVEIIDDELEETAENFIIEFQLTGFPPPTSSFPPSHVTCSAEVWIMDDDIGEDDMEDDIGEDDNGNAGGDDSSLVYATAGAAGGIVVVLSVIVTVVVAVTVTCAIKRKHLPAHHNTFESEMTDTDVRISTSYNKAYGIVAQHSANELVISQNQIADEPEYDYVQ